MSSSPGNGRSLLRADEMTVLSKKRGVEGGREGQKIWNQFKIGQCRDQNYATQQETKAIIR
jgi:lipopolysaccharide export system protein LptA